VDELTLGDAHRALGSGVVVPAAGRGLLELTGPQRIWFLQNTITADVEEVAPGGWVPSCFLDPKGKVMAHFRVGITPDRVVLDIDPPGTDVLADWFRRYRFRTKVEIEDRTTESWVVFGPPAHDLTPDREIVETGDAVLFGDVIGDRPAAFVHGSLPDLGLPHAPPELLNVVTAEAGIGTFGVDYGPDTLPQEAGLTSELSVTKGCYVGQEVVARLHFRGHVNRALRSLAFGSGLPTEGAGLTFEGQAVGRVTSSLVSPALGPIGMGMVRVAVPEGADVNVDGGGTARVGPSPWGPRPSGPLPPSASERVRT
jgi:tRNA-modifying protein YgfZ